MKTNGLNGLVILVVVGMLSVTTMARAQYSPTPQPPSPPTSSNDGNAAQARAKSAALRAMLENFSLTALQKAQINDALKTQRTKMLALQKDPSVTEENQADKIRAIMDETDATLKGIFSPEQFQKWQEATKDLRPPGTATGTNAVVKAKQ